MSAVRVARAATGCDRIVKFEGCYHGHADAFLVQAGSGAMTLGVPTSPGVPSGAARDTLLARYNDLSSVEAIFAQNPKQIAAVFVEPIAGNMGVVTPRPGFLEGLRALCDREHALLVFDEVISGFRAAIGGAQGDRGNPAGSDVPWKDHRWWPARGRVRRPGRRHGPRGTGRPRLSSGHALGQSARDDGWPLVAPGALTQAVPTPDEARGDAGRRPRRCREGRGRAAPGERLRLDADARSSRTMRSSISSRR